ncbi:N-acetyltransferase [Macrococcus equipercicus]|uniref:Uncharacterized N-acetyltransferase ERX35_002145 n=1 Tax=Macrococcus equipercicus TaxID=69967 RepID=A0ABQ6RBY5_9STAP|nr:N-acetyltransferase [Macrococcus equipercicus]KAA1042703.1 N-acetyltransferase [Macrococcus equipercicus]
MTEVTKLEINYKTADDFKKFREVGNQELWMVNELEGNMMDADIESPFYGIYVGENLAARMCLFKKDDVNNDYFSDATDYLVLWKLEVLEKYQHKGYGRQLLDYAKTFGLPIKTAPRLQAAPFFIKQGFVPLEYNLERDLNENVYVWYPAEQ